MLNEQLHNELAAFLKAVPDGCLDYSMEECYGVTSDCWKDALKQIKD